MHFTTLKAKTITKLKGLMCSGITDVIIQRYVDYTGNEHIKRNGEEIVWPVTKK